MRKKYVFNVKVTYTDNCEASTEIEVYGHSEREARIEAIVTAAEDAIYFDKDIKGIYLENYDSEE